MPMPFVTSTGPSRCLAHNFLARFCRLFVKWNGERRRAPAQGGSLIVQTFGLGGLCRIAQTGAIDSRNADTAMATTPANALVIASARQLELPGVGTTNAPPSAITGVASCESDWGVLAFPANLRLVTAGRPARSSTRCACDVLSGGIRPRAYSLDSQRRRFQRRLRGDGEMADPGIQLRIADPTQLLEQFGLGRPFEIRHREQEVVAIVISLPQPRSVRRTRHLTPQAIVKCGNLSTSDV